MITVTIRKSGLLRRAWRIRIQGGNGEILPHEYNEQRSAVKTAEMMFGSDEPVQLRIVGKDGVVVTRMLR